MLFGGVLGGNRPYLEVIFHEIRQVMAEPSRLHVKRKRNLPKERLPSRGGYSILIYLHVPYKHG